MFYVIEPQPGVAVVPAGMKNRILYSLIRIGYL